ncbi:hypothetical protein [Epilithonimonas caeni]|uniref:hypothetical protein n=1 Tax=Epilithonimonas caeni TaxID=365343 RepID=UPI0004275D84|nr:hypothetical protein [Epilithonimonas caeni]
MKNKDFIRTEFLIFILSFITLKYSGQRSIQENCFSMIWNQGITKKSWVYLDQDQRKVYKKNSDITEGDLLKMPKNYWDATYTDSATNQKFGTKEKRNASFKLVTAGYKLGDQNKSFGFDFKVLNNKKKLDEPYIFRITNNARNERFKTLGTLREVGFVFENWPQYWIENKVWTGGAHSFSNNYQVEKLDEIVVRFKFRLVDYSGSLSQYSGQIKQKWLGSYVTCDFRFSEFDENGNTVHGYLLGVLFSNPLNVDYNENPDDGVLWGETDDTKKLTRLLIHGNKNGIKEVNTISDEFQTVEIDFKPLIDKYLKINKNHKNIIVGLDIYSNTRSTDLTYDIQDIQVIGCNKK